MIISKGNDKYAFMCGLSFYESDVIRSGHDQWMLRKVDWSVSRVRLPACMIGRSLKLISGLCPARKWKIQKWRAQIQVYFNPGLQKTCLKVASSKANY